MRKSILLFAVIMVLAGCDKKPVELPSLVEPYTPIEGAVGFDITPPQRQPDGTITCHASYKSNEGTTKFDIKFDPIQSTDKGSSISFGKGALIAVQGSQSDPLLNALKISLKAKRLPHDVHHVDSLPFTYAGLGTGLTRQKEGGFDSKVHGSWTAFKLFFSTQSGEDAEVYVNFSEAARKGEFVIKDPDYGDDLLEQLAKVL